MSDLTRGCLFVQQGRCLNSNCERFEQITNNPGVYPECENEETWKNKEGVGEFPSTGEQVVSFLQSLTDFGKASEAEQFRRLAICQHCDFRRGNRCTSCGCFVFKKVKKPNGECPEGFW